MKSYEIKSDQNKTYRLFLDLLSSSGIVENRQALVFGKKVILETLKTNGIPKLGLIIPIEPDPKKESQLNPELEKALDALKEESSFSFYYLDRKLFESIDIFGTRFPILLVTPPQIGSEVDLLNDLKNDKKANQCHLVVPFQEPSNVGSLLRSGAAFGVDSIILIEGAAHPFHPKSVRAASGSLFCHRYYRLSALSDLPGGKGQTIALDMHGKLLNEVEFPDSFFLIPGVEGPGLPKKFEPNLRVKIPIRSIESLNAPTATAIALYAWSTQKANKEADKA